MSTWIEGTLSVVTGGALTMVAAWIADTRLTRRERERRHEERNERLAVRRNDFQRETLLALQSATQSLARTIASMHIEDVASFRRTGEWQSEYHSDGLAENNRLQMAETLLFATRIRDDEARQLADLMREKAALVNMAANEGEAFSRWESVMDTQQALVQRIGQLISELD